MIVRRLHNVAPLALACAIALAFAGRGAAQAPSPPPPLDLATISNPNIPPGGPLETRICEYAKYWTDIIKNPASNPEAIKQARAELIRPAQGLNTSDNFRLVYAKCVVDPLREVIESNDYHRAINAMLVISQLNEDRALTALLQGIDPRLQGNWQIRHGAAMACRPLLAGNKISAAKVVDSVKRLRDAAKSETNPMVLLRQFEAMAAADHSLSQAEAERAQLRAFFADAFSSVAARVAQNNATHPSSLLEPLGHAVTMWRNKLVEQQLPGSDAAVCKTLGPALGNVLEAIQAHWDQAQNDEAVKAQYGVIVNACETLLTLVDGVVRRSAARPQTKLGNAWNTGSKEAFATDVATWTGVLKPPAYAQR